MSRSIHAGDQSFDWTIWFASARDLCFSGQLIGRHRQIFAEMPESFTEPYDWTDANCDAEPYAIALSSLGWCLRDAGYCAAIERRGYARGLRNGGRIP